MFRKLTWTSAALLLAIGTCGAMQQEPRRGPGLPAFERPASVNVGLLLMREVRTELKLDEEKGKQVEELNAALNQQRRKAEEEYQAKLAEINTRANEATAAMLDAKQRERLEQLKLQRMGLGVLQIPSVATKLGLSDNQVAEIRKLLGINDRGGFPGPLNFTPPAAGSNQWQDLRDQARKALADRAAETNAKVLNVLTSERREKWAEMTGEPFKFPSGGSQTSAQGWMKRGPQN